MSHLTPRRRFRGLRAGLPRAGLSLAAIAGAMLGCAIRCRAADIAFADPAPPAPAQLVEQSPAAVAKNVEATLHAAPRPLAREAVTSDWPSFLGPFHNGVSPETKLLASFPKTGPPLVWEMKKGSGYSAPALVGERLVLLQRVENQEVVDCLKADTGERFWRFAYPTDYTDRYGYCDGPRASPAIGGPGNAWVVTLGAEGKMHCLELSTGRVRWARDLLAEFKLKQNFFGVGTSPLIEGDKVIVNVGAPAGPCVAGFDLKTGKMLWGTAGGNPKRGWGPSYASPIPATVYGKRRVFVFAGGETGPREPVSGGLICLDPETGRADFTFPWRGTRRESVNASSPLILGEQGQLVFISECYGSGGALLEIQPDYSVKSLWKNEGFGTHFMTAIHRDGHLYGIDGHGPQDAFLACVELKTGKELWRKQPEWDETIPAADGRPARATEMGTYRAQFVPTGEPGSPAICLGEYGHLLWVDLQPTGYKELSRAWLFSAGETWTGPVLSRGLLYVNQNSRGTDQAGKPAGPRLLCYDLRAGQ